MPEADGPKKLDPPQFTAENSLTAGEIIQNREGRPIGIKDAVTSGNVCQSQNQFPELGFYVPKSTSCAILDGGKVFWDHSANQATGLTLDGDRDFLLGTAIGDYAASDAFCYVNFGKEPTYKLDLSRDSFETVIIGTQALAGLALLRRGGAHKVVISSTSEAQKVDALSKGSFLKTANAIIEGAFTVIDDGSGTVVDISIGIANATHADNADTITESAFIHLDANNTTINAESDDGTNEVAATSTTTTYTAGTRKEFWIDMRNPASLKWYIDGVQVLGATTFNVNAATGPFKLLLHIEKSSAADTYELDLEWLRARTGEQ